MAKGRKLTTSRSERFLGSYGGYNEGEENGGDDQELGEDDVWPNGDDHFENGTHDEWSARASSESNGSYIDRRQNPLPLADHRRQVGGLSLAFDDSGETAPPRILHQQSMVTSSPRGRHMATSAPVKVPDWSKIYRVDSVESLNDSDDDDPNFVGSEWLPPHEYLARENARTRKMAPNSVFEGVGRKLKGRDLSRVRDAVWSQTGFNG